MKETSLSHLSFLKDSAPTAAERRRLGFFCILASAFLPILLFAPLSDYAVLTLPVLAAGLSIAALARLARSFRAILGYAVILALALFLIGSPVLIGLLAAFIAAAAVLTVLWMTDSSLLLCLAPVLSFTLAFAVVREPFGALFALLPFPAALTLAGCFRKKTERVGSICRLTAAILIPVAALFFLFVFLKSGSLDLSLLKSVFDSLRARITELLLHTLQEMLAGGAEPGSVSPTNIPYLVEITVNYLPAMLIIVGMAIAFLVHLLVLNILISLGIEATDIRPMMIFDMSLVSAIVFVCALVLGSALETDGNIFFSVFANNLYLILIPGMILTALGALKMLLAARGPSCAGALLYLAAILCLISFPSYAIPILSLSGAGFLFTEHAARALGKRGGV